MGKAMDAAQARRARLAAHQKRIERKARLIARARGDHLELMRSGKAVEGRSESGEPEIDLARGDGGRDRGVALQEDELGVKAFGAEISGRDRDQQRSGA